MAAAADPLGSLVSVLESYRGRDRVVRDGVRAPLTGAAGFTGGRSGYRGETWGTPYTGPYRGCAL